MHSRGKSPRLGKESAKMSIGMRNLRGLPDDGLAGSKFVRRN